MTLKQSRNEVLSCDNFERSIDACEEETWITATIRESHRVVILSWQNLGHAPFVYDEQVFEELEIQGLE